ncbi:serine/threonine protein kinase [Streptomyces lunaelactis]|uniref:serine/threonine protein kinase n=1 Tax=Streptomyces lunaelactis TaxID=1535768 RepID=UPI001585697E|nr:serine/threonine protein kinase [Streptomyces lunaelactis]NUK32296.1 serine/threonine protein kinase [Streptomyces lunaelactis]NUK41180.1 serine/threonine protein kinase [Streptomyces lunaelactis]
MHTRPFPDADSVELLEPYLNSVGEIFHAFREQDSGCVSYGVAASGKRWFVKGATTAEAVVSLRRAVSVHATVRHPAIVPLQHFFAIKDGLALLYPWVEGEVLYHPTVARHGGRAAAGSPMARFRRLPIPDVLQALDQILDAHLAVERAGLVAVDLYDGCFLYSFDDRRMLLCDLDEYRPGPFILEADRLPGSRRYMAPEEFAKGSTIDIRTTVYVLGRTLRLLLDAGDEEQEWRGSPAQLAVTECATAVDPVLRFASVETLVKAWRGTTSMPS